MMSASYRVDRPKALIILVMMICPSVSSSSKPSQREMIPFGVDRRQDKGNLIQDGSEHLKLHPYLMPLYGRVGSNNSQLNYDEQFLNMKDEGINKETRSNDYLKKVSGAREKLLMRSAIDSGAWNSTSNKQIKPPRLSRYSLDADLAAINSLIGILLKANNRLTSEKDGRQEAADLSKSYSSQVDKSEQKPEEARVVNETRANADRRDELQQDSVRLDHVLVRPGYNDDNFRRDKSLNPFDDQMNSEAQHHPGELSLTLPMHLSSPPPPPPAYMANEDGQFVSNHKPIVAKDLLHIAGLQQPQPERHQPEYLSQLMHPPGRLNPYNLFRPRPVDQQIRVIDNNYERPPAVISELEPPFGGHHRPGGQVTDVDVDEQHGAYPTSPAPHNHLMVPPYNGRPMASMIGWRRHPMDEDNYGRAHPRLPATTVHPFEAARAKQAALDGAQLAGGNELEPPLNPIQQYLVMAAKSQQAAALSHEKRRLEQELELAKRQEDLRREHENQLARQREQQALGEQQKPAQEEAKPHNESSQQQVNHNQEPGGGEGAANEEEEEGGSAEQQPQPESEEPNQQQQQQQYDNDPDMKEFSGDFDFTKLFPPGVLSEAEIKDMKRQQLEQKLRDEQDNRDKPEEDSDPGSGSNSDSNSNSDSDSSSEPDRQQPQQAAESAEPQQSNANNRMANMDKQQQMLIEQQPTASPGNQSAAVALAAHRTPDKKHVEAQTQVTNTTRATEANGKQPTKLNYLPNFGQATKLANESISLTQSPAANNNSMSSSPSQATAMYPQQSESIHRLALSPRARKIIRGSRDDNSRHPRVRRVSASGESVALAAELPANGRLRSERPALKLILDLDYRERFIEPYLV